VGLFESGATLSLESAVRHFLYQWDRGEEIDEAIKALRAYLPTVELYRVIYTSRSLLRPDEDYDLIAQCVESNQTRGVTGVLLRHEDHYIQILEGHRTDVLTLLEVIKKDKRHTDFLLVRADTCPQRVFQGWHMGSAVISPVEFKLWEATFAAGHRYIDKLVNSFFDGRYKK
jgi:hypothetical protein